MEIFITSDQADVIEDALERHYTHLEDILDEMDAMAFEGLHVDEWTYEGYLQQQDATEALLLKIDDERWADYYDLEDSFLMDEWDNPELVDDWDEEYADA